MKITWRSELLPVLGIITMFVLAVIAWPQAPDSIPIHWGFSGEPDRYAGKLFGLFGAPLISLGVYALLFVLPKLDPRQKNYEFFWSRYLFIRTAVILTLTGISVIVFLWAIGITINMSIAVFMIVGLLLVFIGNYLGKLRSTWFVGIKTPWTLSSEESWRKTHRLGGKLFVIFGLLLAIAAPFQEQWAFISIGITSAAALGYLYLYSYLVWKKDPRKKNGV